MAKEDCVKKPLVSREALACIIDTFDDFLDSKGVKIPNPERDADDPENEANIWGPDFDFLMDSMTAILEEEGLTVAQTFGDDPDPEEDDIESKSNLFLLVDEEDDKTAAVIISETSSAHDISDSIADVKARLEGEWTFDDIVEGLPKDCKVVAAFESLNKVYY